ncbi:monovalent cation/H+ antiporter subunit B [Haloferax mucosum ATCC BAA-1512]|uniref:Monovalent cation/H+ antiporter subunit B n=1 Tax=Haloferax mucosum ATCC BAA-1512 TaxID=662479 RepID=M0IG99_9EURY|nr:monovalent cation/H+ antiporter subunit B [Haloferax mucosum ATCC BAA-1512]
MTATVHLLAPFVLTFVLFTLFHGTSSVGGGFQGGVVTAVSAVGPNRIQTGSVRRDRVQPVWIPASRI